MNSSTPYNVVVGDAGEESQIHAAQSAQEALALAQSLRRVGHSAVLVLSPTGFVLDDPALLRRINPH